MAGLPGSGAPRRLFVDSGAWLALFSARDGQHQAADRRFRAAHARKIPLLTSNLVLAEVHRLVLFRAGILAAATALDRIEASPRVTTLFPDPAIHREARGWLSRLGDQVITYTDATSFALMRAHRCEVALAFDRDFALAGFSLWEVRE